MFRRLYLTILLALALTLAACGGAEPTPEPTEPPPTATPIPPTATPEPEPTEPPDPTADFETISSDVLGLSIMYPSGWTAEDTEQALGIASDPALLSDDIVDLEEGMLVTLISFDEMVLPFVVSEETDTSDMGAVATSIAQDLFLADQENLALDSDAAAMSLGPISGQGVSFSGTTTEGDDVAGQLIAAMDADNARVVVAVQISSQANQAEFDAIFDQMLSTVELSEPSVTMEEMIEEEMASESEEEAAEEGTNTAVAMPTGSTSLDPGTYIYSNANKVRGATIFNDQLWAATTGGLVRYDLATGDSKKYTPQDGLPNIGVYQAVTCPVNGEETLILGTREGLYVYNPADDSFADGATIGFGEPFQVNDLACDAANGRLIFDYDDVTILDLATGETQSFTEDENGLAWFSMDRIVPQGNDIWVPTGYSGASLIAPDGTVTVYSAEAGNFPDDDITDVATAVDGSLWFGAGAGLFKLSNGEITTFDRDNSPAINFFGPDLVEVAPDGALWLGFSSTVCQFDEATGECAVEFALSDTGLSNEASLANMEVLDDGRILIHSYDHGSAVYDGESWTAYALDNQTPSNFFDKFYQTSDGTIWTLGEGVYKTDLDVTEWTRQEGIFADDMLEDPNGTLWFVSGRRLYQFDGQQVLEYDEEAGMADLSHRLLALTDDGLLYAAGDGGYTVIDPTGPSFTAVDEAAGWEFGNIRDLTYSDGTVYAATTDGLAALNGDSYEVLLDETFVNLPNNNIAAVGIMPDGRLALGTTAGLAYYDGSSVEAVSDVTGSVSDLFVTPNGEIWLTAFNSGTFFGSGGNDDGGIYHFDGSGWSRISFDDGLPMDSPRAIFVDNAGTIWAGFGDTGLGGGIYRIVP